jgi:hypothetical protein
VSGSMAPRRSQVHRRDSGKALNGFIWPPGGVSEMAGGAESYRVSYARRWRESEEERKGRRVHRMPDAASIVSCHGASLRFARGALGPRDFGGAVDDRPRTPRGERLAAAEQLETEYAGQPLTSFLLYALKAPSMEPNDCEETMKTTKTPIPGWTGHLHGRPLFQPLSVTYAYGQKSSRAEWHQCPLSSTGNALRGVPDPPPRPTQVRRPSAPRTR